MASSTSTFKRRRILDDEAAKANAKADKANAKAAQYAALCKTNPAKAARDLARAKAALAAAVKTFDATEAAANNAYNGEEKAAAQLEAAETAFEALKDAKGSAADIKAARIACMVASRTLRNMKAAKAAAELSATAARDALHAAVYKVDPDRGAIDYNIKAHIAADLAAKAAMN